MLPRARRKEKELKLSTNTSSKFPNKWVRNQYFSKYSYVFNYKEDENGKLIKSKFYEEVYKTDKQIKEKLAEDGLRTEPREIVNNFGDEFRAEKTSYSDEL